MYSLLASLYNLVMFLITSRYVLLGFIHQLPVLASITHSLNTNVALVSLTNLFSASFFFFFFFKGKVGLRFTHSKLL
jgi:hypothetical protein